MNSSISNSNSNNNNYNNNNNKQLFSSSDQRELLLVRCKTTIDDLKAELGKLENIKDQIQTKYDNLQREFHRQEKDMEEEKTFAEGIIEELTKSKREMEIHKDEMKQLKFQYGEQANKLLDCELYVKTLLEKIEIQDAIIKEYNCELGSREQECTTLRQGKNQHESYWVQANNALKSQLEKNIQLLKEAEQKEQQNQKKAEEMASHIKQLDDHIKRQDTILLQISQQGLTRREEDEDSDSRSSKQKKNSNRSQAENLVMEQADLIRRQAEQINELEKKIEFVSKGREQEEREQHLREQLKETENELEQMKLECSSEIQKVITLIENKDQELSNTNFELERVKQESLESYHQMQEIIQSNEEALNLLSQENEQCKQQIQVLKDEKDKESQNQIVHMEQMEVEMQKLKKEVWEIQAQKQLAEDILRESENIRQQKQNNVSYTMDNDLRQKRQLPLKSYKQLELNLQEDNKLHLHKMLENKFIQSAGEEIDKESTREALREIVSTNNNNIQRTSDFITTIQKQAPEQKLKLFFQNEGVRQNIPLPSNGSFSQRQELHKKQEFLPNEELAQKRRRKESTIDKSKGVEGSKTQRNLRSVENEGRSIKTEQSKEIVTKKDSIITKKGNLKSAKIPLQITSQEMKMKILILEQALSLKQTENSLLKEGIQYQSSNSLNPSANSKFKKARAISQVSNK